MAEIATTVTPPTRPVRGFLESAGDLTVFVGETARELPRAPVLHVGDPAAGGDPRARQHAVRPPVHVLHRLFGGHGGLLLPAGGSGRRLVGFFQGITNPRAAAPIMFGYVFAAKVGCGLVAELGVMRTTTRSTHSNPRASSR